MVQTFLFLLRYASFHLFICLFVCFAYNAYLGQQYILSQRWCNCNNKKKKKRKKEKEKEKKNEELADCGGTVTHHLECIRKEKP